MPNFASRFRELRKERKLNQDKMGEILGVTRRTICNYESGVYYPDFKNLLSIAEYFQVSLDYLVGWSDRREIDKGDKL